MSYSTTWREVESEVYQPAGCLVAVVGALFIVAGVAAYKALPGAVPGGFGPWIVYAAVAICVALGAAIAAWSVNGALFKTRVRHAAADVVPGVSQEPVLLERSVVHGRLSHRLYEGAKEWHFRPPAGLWRSDRRFLLGFGVPFLAIFAALLTVAYHTQWKPVGWPMAAACAIAVTLVCGGTVLTIIALVLRAGHRRLSSLTIPLNGGDLVLDMAEAPDPASMDLIAGLEWFVVGNNPRRLLTVPRGSLRAVQLCPWKFAVGGRAQRSVTWAVQGLLVLGTQDRAEYLRLPIVLTSDLRGAARLMQKLAETLRVPYLFAGNYEGWKVEAARAGNREPLRAGGMIS